MKAMKKLLLIILVFCSLAVNAQVSTTFATKVSDPDGTVTSVKIEVVSGPTGAIVATPNPPVTAVSTGVSFPAEGIYVLQLTAIDNDGGISRYQWKATVVKNQLPKIEIIPDVTLKLK